MTAARNRAFDSDILTVWRQDVYSDPGIRWFAYNCILSYWGRKYRL